MGFYLNKELVINYLNNLKEIITLKKPKWMPRL